MQEDFHQWTRSCLACQEAKVLRHTVSPIGRFPSISSRLAHVHMDIVGPLPPSNGMVYLPTIIDRFTRWPEAIPIPNVTSEVITSAFIERWVEAHGCPATITTDCGPQFESQHFTETLNVLGCHSSQTTAYHPKTNSMVERFHRQLEKAALSTVDGIRWTEALPMVLLGIPAALKADPQVSSAELLHGQPLRLPED